MSSEYIQKNKKQEKIKKLEEELDKKSKLAEERLNQLKYLHADFDNYRKKFDKEKEDIIKLANEKLIKELLVIIDDFERFLSQIKDEKEKEGFMIFQKDFHDIMSRQGLKIIDAKGKFNPNVHEVLVKEKTDKEDGMILEEIRKGYILKGKVIRPSLVKISEKS